jgi:acyl-CoA dehydrogenase
MNLDFSDDQKLLRDQLRRFLSEKCTPAAVREILESPEPFDRKLYEGLGALGALGAAIPEEYGGVGLGQLELCVLAEELGRSFAPTPTSSSIYLVAEALLMAGSEEQKHAWLPTLATGETVGAFALAEAPGRTGPASIKAFVEDGRLTGVKTAVADGAAANVCLVAARRRGSSDADVSLYIVDLSAPGIVKEPLESIDPTRSVARLRFDGATAEPLGSEPAGWGVIDRVMDRAAILIAFEQVGGADRALEMGRDYALERMAFGRPIGSFQAIKHMLADMYVQATLARSNAYYGAFALSTDAPDLPIAAATARVSATEAFQLCAKNNIQVHGGMGFTWAFDCHLLYRRSNALALALGSLSTWDDLLIERMRRQNQPQAAVA